MLKEIMTAYDGKKWTGFPTIADEKPVWGWLRSLETRFLAGAPYELHTAGTAFDERKGQMDLFFLRRPPTEAPLANTPLADARSTRLYKDVLVVGKQKKSHTGRFKEEFCQLAHSVRSAFADQPTRRFVHAFSFYASKMELWVFDRSGPYSSGIFDIHKEPHKFARAFIGYATLDNDTMGLDTFIRRENTGSYVILNKTNGQETTLKLDQAMVRQAAIVCRGTTCYRTQDSYVAKFSWASDKQKPEVEHLKLAAQNNVQGVARVVAYHQITTIREMREGLVFPKPCGFGDDEVRSGLATTSASLLGNKRKSPHDDMSNDASQSKKQRSSKNQSLKSQEGINNMPGTQSLNSIQEGISTDETSNNMSGARSLKSQEGKNRPSLYIRNKDDPWDNRIYSCLVISPAGRVINQFTTTIELLESMRDAIKAHQSLWKTANILHRDISSNNIIITDPKAEGANGFKGMLIDLDLAKIKDSAPSGARHQTGTVQFMAVQVLKGIDHTYRHDLESFFYVLVWMCARQSWSNGFAGKEKPPKPSLLRRWETEGFSDMARVKSGDMDPTGLEGILAEFPKTLRCVKPLCRKLRAILFRDTKFYGTPEGDPDQLYEPIIKAYDQLIMRLIINQYDKAIVLSVARGLAFLFFHSALFQC